MTIRPLVILPDSKLRLVSEPIKEVTDEIRRLADDMLETMYDAPGVGLAAIQIGVPLRMVTMDVSKSEDERQPMVLINPEIVWASEEKRTYEEGCLSIPEYYEEVERPDRVRFRYMNLQGETVEQDADGLLATCVQHEIDHLNGVLFIDYLSKLKRDRVMTKFKKAAKREAGRMSLRVVFMGTPDFAVPTLSEIVGQGHDVVAVYTRAPAAAGRGMELKPSPVHQMADRFGLPVLHAEDPAHGRGCRDLPQPRCRCGRGGGLRHAAAEGDPRGAGTRLPQPACLPASALARRGSDPARRHGRRQGNAASPS